MFTISHQPPAIRRLNVIGQFGPAAGGVDPDHHRTTQRRGGQPEDELGHIVEQHPHVRPAGTGHGGQQRRPRGRLPGKLGIAPGRVLEQERR